MTMDTISLLIGIFGGFIVGVAFMLIIRKFKKKNFKNLKEMVRESYEHLLEAAKLQKELYDTFNKISEGI